MVQTRINHRVLISGIIAFVAALIVTNTLCQSRVIVSGVSGSMPSDPTAQYQIQLRVRDAWFGFWKYKSDPQILRIDIEKPLNLDINTENEVDSEIQQLLSRMGWSKSPHAFQIRVSFFVIQYLIPLAIAVWVMMYHHRRLLAMERLDVCSHCGYNLIDLPSNRCPECGKISYKNTLQ
tara:strand:- start:1292 stop:1825 length:534 start_codon:yes stop_codon:yes gene_type:complete